MADSGAVTRAVPRRAATPARLPLSAGQRREWFRHEWAGPAGNVVVAVRLGGELGVDQLRRALHHVGARHEALRLTFGAEGGVPFQVLGPPAPPGLDTVVLPGEHPADRERAVPGALDAELGARLDLAAGPPWRARLLQVGTDDHVLALTLHPLCADQRSAELVLADLARAYSAYRAGREPTEAPLPVHYPDVVVRQRERQAGGGFADDLRYWRHRLSGLPVVELPADRPRPAAWSGRRGVVDTELTGPVGPVGPAGPVDEGRGPLAFVVAGFAALVARYTRGDEVVLGTVLPGRSSDLEGVVGPLATPVVLRLDVTGDPTFGQLLERAGAVLEDAERHGDVPFASVVAELRPAPEPSRHPLFSLAVDRATPVAGVQFAGLRAQRCDLPTARRDLDLALTVAAGDGTARLRVEYATDLFDRSRVERLVRHLCRVLRAGGDDPSLPLSRLAVLDGAERDDLLRQGRGARLTHRTVSLDRLVSEQAARTPRATAVVARGQELSYAELEARADRLAAALRERGVRPGSLVGVLCPRDITLVPCLLGVLKTGAAYVPLDLSHPADRLAMILADARPAALVTQPALLDRLPADLGVPVVQVGADADSPDSADGPDGPAGTTEPAGPARTRTHPDALCEVLFTSGSTGRPKGVATSHRNVVSFLDGLLATVPPDRFARVALATSVSFDACLVELWPPLVTGGTLVVVDNLLLASSSGELEGITMLNAVPSVLTAFLRVAPVPVSARTVTVGAEPLPPALVEEVFRHSEAGELYNMYGPTETTVYVTAARLDRGRRQPVTIGRPMPNVRAYVLDRYGELAPAGVPGELCLAGPGVARGYLGQPGLTAERFPADPFGPPGERMYRTGDLCRWRTDGGLDFLGRIDTQVKVRGFRIELGEVEATLARHPAVKAAVAAVRTGSGGEPELVGYVLPAGPAPDPDELTALARRTLPAYMVPTTIVVVTEIPRSPNGKLDRAALPAPPDSRRGRRPSGPVQRELAAIWSALLRRDTAGDPVGADDDFFALGGNSLLALRVRAEIRRRCGVSLPVPTLFQQSTLAALAGAVADAMVRAAGPDVLSRLIDDVAGTAGACGSGEGGHG